MAGARETLRLNIYEDMCLICNNFSWLARLGFLGWYAAMLRITRGLTLVLIGFASKAYFLLLIAPGMEVGEFARYFLAASLAVIAGRILAMGARDDLVFRIKNNLKRIAYYLRGATLYFLAAWLLMFVSASVGDGSSVVAATMAYALVIAGNNFLTGALRPYSNAFQEFNANAPWLVVCLLSILTRIEHAAIVLQLLVVGHTTVYLADILIVRHLGVDVGSPRIRVLENQFRRFRSWLPKSISSMALAANLRSYPIWLSALGFILSDTLAYAFVIGEIIFQLCMVYVHQVHSNLALQEGLLSAKRMIRIAVVMLSLAALVPVPVYYVLSSGIVANAITVPFETLINTSIYCGTLAFFSLVRIGIWRKDNLAASIRVLLMQFIFFIVVGLLVSIMSYNVSLLLVAGAANIAMIVVYLSSRYHNEKTYAMSKQ